MDGTACVGVAYVGMVCVGVAYAGLVCVGAVCVRKCSVCIYGDSIVKEDLSGCLAGVSSLIV